MRRWSEAHYHHPRGGVTETGHRTAPVLLIGEGCPLLVCDLLAPLHESWAPPARRDFIRQCAKGLGAAHWGGSSPVGYEALFDQSIHPFARSSARRWIDRTSSSETVHVWIHGR